MSPHVTGTQIQPTAPQLEAPQAPQIQQAAQPQRLADIVHNARVLPAPAPRAAEAPRPAPSLASKIGLVALRVLLGIGSLGLTELAYGIIRLAERRANPDVQAPAPGVPGAAPQAAQFNQSVAEALRRGQPLPEALRGAESDAIAGLREQFGDLVPENATLDALPSPLTLTAEIGAGVQRLDGEVTPERLRDIIKDKAAPHILSRAVENSLAAALTQAGHRAEAPSLLSSLRIAMPELFTAVQGCTNRAALDAVLSSFQPALREFAAADSVRSEAQTAAFERALDLLAARFQLSREQLTQSAALAPLTRSLSDLAAAMRTSRDSAAPDEVQRRFITRADSFALTKIALADSLDELDISEELRTAWAGLVLTQEELDSGDIFTSAVTVAAQQDVSGLAALFPQDGPLPSGEMVHARFQSLSLTLEDSLRARYGDAWQTMGPNAQGTARFYAAQALFDRVPGLRDAFEAHPELLREVEALSFELNRAATQAAPHSGGVDPNALARISSGTVLDMVHALSGRADNAALAASVARQRLPLPYLMALNSADAAVRQAFPDTLSEDALSMPLVDGGTVLDALQQTVSQAEERLSPDAFRELARTLLARAAAESTARTETVALAQTMGVTLTPAEADEQLRLLTRREPEAGDELRAADAQSVRDALGRLDALRGLITLKRDMDEALHRAHERLYPALAEALAAGPGADELRDSLNLAKLDDQLSAVLRQIASDRTDPQKPLPDAAAIDARLDELVTGFVRAKAAVYAGIDALAVSDELKAAWKRDALAETFLLDAQYFARCLDAAQAMDAADLLALLQRPAASNEDLAAQLVRLGRLYNQGTHSSFANVDNASPDASAAIQHYVLQAFFDRNPLPTLAPERFAALDSLMTDRTVQLTDRLAMRLDDEEFLQIRALYGDFVIGGELLDRMRPAQA